MKRQARAYGPEIQYRNELLRFASRIMAGLREGGPAAAIGLEERAIRGWGWRVAEQMLRAVASNDLRGWLSQKISENVKREILITPTGGVYTNLQLQQVELIRSLPLYAAQRVHELAQQALISGERSEVWYRQVGHELEWKCVLIARTETARAASNFMQARAEGVGLEGYWWETARDATVRKSHKQVQGRWVRWDSPPTLDKMTGHAGCFPNCRCIARLTDSALRRAA